MTRFGPSAIGRLIGAGALALGLAACGSVNDPREDKVGAFLVAPGKYQLYDCQQLAQAAAPYFVREKELREVRTKAESGPGGELISSLAYGSEYGQVRGNIDELRREAAEKKCDLQPPSLAESNRPNMGQAPRR